MEFQPLPVGSNRSSHHSRRNSAPPEFEEPADVSQVLRCRPNLASSSFRDRVNSSRIPEVVEETLDISIEYQFCLSSSSEKTDVSGSFESERSDSSISTSSEQGRAFSSFFAAGFSANPTLPNYRIKEKGIGGILLPIFDSPRDFVPLSGHVSHVIDSYGYKKPPKATNLLLKSTSTPSCMAAPSVLDDSALSFFTGLRTAGGPAGEDRLQVICSEDDNWLYCGIYDGFNGRGAADFVAGSLYKSLVRRLQHLEMRSNGSLDDEFVNVGCLSGSPGSFLKGLAGSKKLLNRSGPLVKKGFRPNFSLSKLFVDRFQGLLKQSLCEAILETERDFMEFVEAKLDDLQDLAMSGCCVVSVLIHGDVLYIANLGDSKAILGTSSKAGHLNAVTLTFDHNLTNKLEQIRVELEHQGEDVVSHDARVAGKLKVTRAFGALYMKHEKINQRLFPVFRLKNKFQSFPYISSEPYLRSRKITSEDKFIIVGSDGLFDLFSPTKAVELVANFMDSHPGEDCAKYLLEVAIKRAAANCNMTVRQLSSIPKDERRKYHDDVTVVIISLENGQTNSASIKC